MSPGESPGMLMGTCHPGPPAALQGPRQHRVGSKAGQEGILPLFCINVIHVCVQVLVRSGWRVAVPPPRAGSLCRQGHLPCLPAASSLPSSLSKV